MPSLHERREDIQLLVAHFLQQFNARNNLSVTIEHEAVTHLQNMNWPGNVRELENSLNRLAIFAPTGRITLADIESETQRGREERNTLDTSSATPERLLEVERQHILKMLKQTRGNRSEAARRLGIERKTLYKKVLRLGIDFPDRERK